MEKRLPEIVIKGTLQKLIEIEAVLAHYYDVPDEEWNNTVTTPSNRYRIDHMLLTSDGQIQYHSHSCNVYIPFYVSDLNKILGLIES